MYDSDLTKFLPKKCCCKCLRKWCMLLQCHYLHPSPQNSTLFLCNRTQGSQQTDTVSEIPLTYSSVASAVTVALAATHEQRESSCRPVCPHHRTSCLCSSAWAKILAKMSVSTVTAGFSLSAIRISYSGSSLRLPEITSHRL